MLLSGARQKFGGGRFAIILWQFSWGKCHQLPERRDIYKVRMHIGYRNTLFVWEYNTPQKDRPVECLENCDNWQTLLKLWKTLKLWNNLVKQFSKALGLREAGRNLPNSGPFRGWWAGLGWWVEGWVRWWFKQVEWWRNHEKHIDLVEAPNRMG